jgi:hypothetical protein
MTSDNDLIGEDSRALLKSAERPLVTFALIAYNQARWVREAIDGAFRQDYRPLEIVLSDDCSTDDTFGIMQKAAAECPGDISLKVVKGTTNRGIGAHLNAVMAHASGDLVVIAAGDDISRSDRTTKLVSAWLSQERRPGLLHSSCSLISLDGDSCGSLKCNSLDSLESAHALASSNERVIGATGAWVPALFQVFGDLRADLVHEDRALPFRSLLLGRPISYVDEPLVAYRQGAGVSTLYWQNRHIGRSERVRILSNLRADILQKIADLSFRNDGRLKEVLDRSLSCYEVALTFETGFPRPGALLRMLSDAGPVQVIRMAIKRVANIYLDYRHGG